jgi:hypothetical protein
LGLLEKHKKLLAHIIIWFKSIQMQKINKSSNNSYLKIIKNWMAHIFDLKGFKLVYEIWINNITAHIILIIIK